MASERGRGVPGDHLDLDVAPVLGRVDSRGEWREVDAAVAGVAAGQEDVGPERRSPVADLGGRDARPGPVDRAPDVRIPPDADGVDDHPTCSCGNSSARSHAWPGGESTALSAQSMGCSASRASRTLAASLRGQLAERIPDPIPRAGRGNPSADRRRPSRGTRRGAWPPRRSPAGRPAPSPPAGGRRGSRHGTARTPRGPRREPGGRHAGVRPRTPIPTTAPRTRVRRRGHPPPPRRGITGRPTSG